MIPASFDPVDSTSMMADITPVTRIFPRRLGHQSCVTQICPEEACTILHTQRMVLLLHVKRWRQFRSWMQPSAMRQSSVQQQRRELLVVLCKGHLWELGISRPFRWNYCTRCVPSLDRTSCRRRRQGKEPC
jgi:hypothetical protein